MDAELLMTVASLVSDSGDLLFIFEASETKKEEVYCQCPSSFLANY